MSVSREIQGWDCWQRQTAAGGVESEQRITLDRPVVEFSEEGGRRLGLLYWQEVERFTLRLVRVRERRTAVEARLFGCGPLLLRFDAPAVDVSASRVRCSYPIRGGLLARLPQGRIEFVQADGEPLVLRSTIRDFFPSLAAREGEPHWTGALYSHVQSRMHVAISRRYFRRMVAEGPT